MENKKELDKLINKVNNIPAKINDDDLKLLYNEAMGVFRNSKYTQEEKAYFKKNAWLEMLAMCCDGII